MKTRIILAIVFSLGLYFAQAQSMGKGKNVFYLGAGPGSGYIGSTRVVGSGYSYSRSPSFHLGLEHGISEAIPNSIIGLGPHLSAWFASNSYRDNNGRGWEKKWSDFTVAGKVYYHHKFLVGDRWDVYAAAIVGAKYRNYTFSTTDPYYEYARDTYSTVAPVVGVGVGGRFYVTDVFGFYAEVNGGYNADWGQIGLAFKF